MGLGPTRIRLPKQRRGFNQEATVGNHKLFVRTGEYEDGTLGEVFVDMHRVGTAFRSVLGLFAIAVSFGLQHGVPLEKFVDRFVGTRFEPDGIVTGYPQIRTALSIVDYIFRVLGIAYLHRKDLGEPVEEGLDGPGE